jgi:iron complex outermembrane receptor protein
VREPSPTLRNTAAAGYRGSSGGLGNLDTDRFNLLATFSYRDAKALRGDQRDFVNTFQVDRGLSVDTRGTPHATIFPLAGTLFPNAASTPFVPGSTTVRASGGINVLDLPGAEGCNAVPGMDAYSNALWNLPWPAPGTPAVPPFCSNR